MSGNMVEFEYMLIGKSKALIGRATQQRGEHVSALMHGTPLDGAGDL